MARTVAAPMTVAQVMAELAAFEDPKVRAVNARHGDDHGGEPRQATEPARRRAAPGLVRRPGPGGRERRLGADHRPGGARQPDGLDLPRLLDTVEAEMTDAPPRLQWAMDHCLAQIGIEHPEHRARAIDIGERLQVLKDHPTPVSCTSPFAPVWTTEMVRRQHHRSPARW